jgi:general nucleoside transport system ATP-binding protein
VLYISHKLDEVRRLCEAATILRQGRVVERCDPRAETAASLARMMVGSAVADVRRARAEDAAGPVRLRVDGLDLPSEDPHGTASRSVALDLRAGEILGIAGVAGNGQDELFAALSGERRARAGMRPAGRHADRREGINDRRRAAAPSSPRSGWATPRRRAWRCPRTRWSPAMPPTASSGAASSGAGGCWAGSTR